MVDVSFWIVTPLLSLFEYCACELAWLVLSTTCGFESENISSFLGGLVVTLNDAFYTLSVWGFFQAQKEA